MDLSELRLDLKNYNAQREVFRLEKYLNQNHTKTEAEIEERAADLFFYRIFDFRGCVLDFLKYPFQFATRSPDQFFPPTAKRF